MTVSKAPIDLSQLIDLYEQTKLAVIFAESFSPRNAFPVASLNELRSTLDHIMKAFDSEKDRAYELNEAKEHLNRAGYDAYEIASSNLGLEIQQLLKPFSLDVVTTVFPEYYTEIKPELTRIKSTIAEIRKRKNENSKLPSEFFKPYSIELNKLIEFKQRTESIIPSLAEVKRKHKRRAIRSFLSYLILGAVSTILAGIIAGVVLYRILPNNSNNFESVGETKSAYSIQGK
jgi:DNA repair exonuclease SbcCD ATPase subunit